MSEERPARAIAIVRDYPALRRALVARRHELGMSQLEVDHRAGLCDAYTGKLEIGTRCFGDMSLAAILGALGLEIVIQPRDPHTKSSCPL